MFDYNISINWLTTTDVIHKSIWRFYDRLKSDEKDSRVLENRTRDLANPNAHFNESATVSHLETYEK